MEQLSIGGGGNAFAREKRSAQREEHVETPKRPSSSRSSFQTRPTNPFAASSQRTPTTRMQLADTELNNMRRLYGTALSQTLLAGRDGAATPKSRSSSNRSSRPRPPDVIERQTVVNLADSLILDLLPSALSSHRRAVEAAGTPNSNMLRKPRSRSPARSVSAHMGVESYLTRTKLKLREDREISSAEAGELLVSTIVSVLEQAELSDGTKRARVAKYGSAEPLGWVSCLGKDQMRNLIPFDWTRFSRIPRSVPSTPPPEVSSVAALATTAPGATSGAGPEGAASPKKAWVPLCATRRASFASAPRMTVEVPPASGAAAVPSSSPPSSPEPSSPSVRVRRESKEGGAKAARASERFTPKSSDELQELVTELETELATEQGKVEHIWKPRHGTTIGQLKIKLGVTLMNTNRNAKPADFAKPWSTDSKGRPTKEINLMGFRKQLRNIIEWANVKDIDGLFSEVDKDGGGTLDAAELTSFMKKLHDIAVNANSIEKAIQENIDALRQRIDFAQEVVNTTLEAERTESRLAVMANNSMVSARLGNAILRKATKIPDLVTSWDQTDGLVDKKQFRKNVRGYGVEGNDASMDELFNTIDKENGDGSGLVSAETLRTTLGSFREDAVEVDRETQRLKKVAEQTWKQVKSSQIELRKRRKAEEADAKAKEELAAAQAAERFKAAEEAQAAKDAKEQAKKEKEEEERAEYEAKIMARRRNSMTAVGAKLPSSPVGY